MDTSTLRRSLTVLLLAAAHTAALAGGGFDMPGFGDLSKGSDPHYTAPPPVTSPLHMSPKERKTAEILNRYQRYKETGYDSPEHYPRYQRPRIHHSPDFGWGWRTPTRWRKPQHFQFPQHWDQISYWNGPLGYGADRPDTHGGALWSGDMLRTRGRKKAAKDVTRFAENFLRQKYPETTRNLKNFSFSGFRFDPYAGQARILVAWSNSIRARAHAGANPFSRDRFVYEGKRQQAEVLVALDRFGRASHVIHHRMMKGSSKTSRLPQRPLGSTPYNPYGNYANPDFYYP